jgi:serine phosphatase RsbU (regulator of sigma subunit)
MGLLAIPLAWFLKWLTGALRRKFKKDVSFSREFILDNIRHTKKRFSESELLETFVSSIQEAFRPQVYYCLPVAEGRVALPPVPKKMHTGHEHGKGQGAQEIILPPKLLRHAKESRELVYDLGNDESDWIIGQSKDMRTHLNAMGVQLMVLIIAGDLPHSVLLLGGKYAELSYSREDRELLREAAIAEGIVIESAIMHRQVIDKTRLDQELLAAQKIQESLISSAPPVPGFQIASRLVAAAETGGDLLWVKQRAPGRWIAVVGDVSGKGLAAALYMSQSVALIEHASQDPDAPMEQILSSMDKALRNLMSNKDFLTLSIIEWSEDGKFKVVRAGHPPPILLANSRPDAPIFISPAGLALGLLPASQAKWQVFDGFLQPGDWIAMYSDGITEAMDSGGNLYGAARLAEQLKRFWRTGSPRAACEAIFQNVTAFEALNRDDMTLFIMAREKEA